MLPEIKPIHAKFAQPLEGKCMRPDDVNFSLSTSSEILSEKADLISMELLQSVLFAVNSPIRIDTPNLEALIYRGYESDSLAPALRVLHSIPLCQGVYKDKTVQ